MKTKHEWVALIQIHLTDKEAAQAYTFDHHGKQVVASKLRENDGLVDVGCLKCEEAYRLVSMKECAGEKS